MDRKHKNQRQYHCDTCENKAAIYPDKVTNSNILSQMVGRWIGPSLYPLYKKMVCIGVILTVCIMLFTHGASLLWQFDGSFRPILHLFIAIVWRVFIGLILLTMGFAILERFFSPWAENAIAYLECFEARLAQKSPQRLFSVKGTVLGLCMTFALSVWIFGYVENVWLQPAQLGSGAVVPSLRDDLFIQYIPYIRALLVLHVCFAGAKLIFRSVSMMMAILNMVVNMATVEQKIEKPHALCVPRATVNCPFKKR